MSLPEDPSLRPEQVGDEAFLFEVYASTRAEELALTSWDQATRQTFLAMQFRAMRQGYRALFPSAEFGIIESAGRRSGLLVINRDAAEIRVVDIALAPEQRNRGIGTLLMRQMCAEAAEKGTAVRLNVLKNNPAARWYARLGFRKVGETGVYDELEWRAAAQPA
jgi:ribosomal protein S18 acetylase RimI-like enzyme